MQQCKYLHLVNEFKLKRKWYFDKIFWQVFDNIDVVRELLIFSCKCFNETFAYTCGRIGFAKWKRERERKTERVSEVVEIERRSAAKLWKGSTIADSERERSEALHLCVWVTADSGYRKSSTTTISSSPSYHSTVLWVHYTSFPLAYLSKGVPPSKTLVLFV